MIVCKAGELRQGIPVSTTHTASKSGGGGVTVPPVPAVHQNVTAARLRKVCTLKSLGYGMTWILEHCLVAHYGAVINFIRILR